ncbi:DUF4325 domain-containing protein [Puteibacter caeruleilacunae]|nr:DUF4325 domain-containing protein [Puteibacter caeruleilacunae]
MKEITINIVSVVGNVDCTEASDGEKVYKLIEAAFREDKNVILSFLNVELITTAFLNTAIGQLYKEFSEEKIKELLQVDEMTQSGLISLKRVVDTAKVYYKDPDAMRRSINDILGEE